MIHRGVLPQKRHLVVAVIPPRAARHYSIDVGACGRWDVIGMHPASVTLGFACKPCLAKIGKSIERMARP